MSIRTYIRVLFNFFFKTNFIVRFIKNVVNFYYKIWFNDQTYLKFEQNMPTNTMKDKCNLIFQSVTGDEIERSL